MKNISKFQIITLAIFVMCIIVGVAAFALYKGNSQNAALPNITIWGTFPAATFNQYVSTINNNQAQALSITYVQKRPDNFSNDFVNALAIGQGPDVILVSADLILPQKNKLTVIPYSVFSQRNFMDSYVQEASVYLSKDGILAIPFTVDPLVMYWNRDTYNSAGIATYARYWDEFTGTALKPGLVQKLTKKDENSNLKKTTIAMGDFSNTTNAREVLGSLMLQSGNPVTMIKEDGSVVSTINSYSYPGLMPAFKFYTQFVDPSDVNYSWNRGLANDKTAFLAGSLSSYFGFASELADIRIKNPNLNFDVAPLPQLRNGGVKASYAKMFGFSLVRASSKLDAAYQSISLLTSPQYLSGLSKTMYLPPVSTSLITKGSTDPYLQIFDEAALISKTWLDIDPTSSRQIFGALVQAITSSKSTVDMGIRDAGDEYDVILKQI